MTGRDSTLAKGEIPIIIGGFTKYTAPPQPDPEKDQEEQKDSSSPRRRSTSPQNDEKDMDAVGTLWFTDAPLSYNEIQGLSSI